ncbi:PAS domain S-box protein [Natrinema halophilum]|uniref:PAS domain S-box protein n=1 Tax=Natrinema halophilum TaxID=1699371 RepID=UPI001F1D69D8|nr:PAS domain S-box protein [Natrinema halophilum]UHQ96075.1 PAS domain-containing protein [Natrinema halophilum]
MNLPIRVLYVNSRSEVEGDPVGRLGTWDGRLRIDVVSTAAEAIDHLFGTSYKGLVYEAGLPDDEWAELFGTVTDHGLDIPIIRLGEEADGVNSSMGETVDEDVPAPVTDCIQVPADQRQSREFRDRLLETVQPADTRYSNERAGRLLSAIAGQASDVFFVYSGDWSELYFVNEAYEDIWGVPVSELRNDPESFLDYIHPEDREKAIESMKRLESGEPDQVEYRVQRPDGELRWIRGKTEPVVEDGTVLQIVGYVRDITQEKERKEELQALKDRYEALVEHGQDVMAVIDRSGCISYVSSSVENILGYEPAELRGENAFGYMHPADRHNAWSTFSSLINSDRLRTDRVQHRFETADGSWVWLESIGSNMTDSSLDGYVMTGRDISSQKERERELDRTNAILSTLIESMPIGILVEDASRSVLTMNRRMVELLDWEGEPEDALGRDCERLAETVSEQFSDPEGFVDRIDELVSAREPVRREELSLEGGRTFERSYLPIDLPGDSGHLWLYRDVTDEKEREKTIRDAKTKLEAAIEAGSVGTWEWDVENDAIVTNPSFARQFDVAKAEPVDAISIDEFLDAIHEDDTPRVSWAVEQALDECGDYYEEYRVRNDDDELRWISARGTVECDEDGNPNRFTGAAVDITDRKRHERQLEELSRTTQELVAASSRESVVDTGVRAARDILGLDATAIHLRTEEQTALTPVAATDVLRELIGDPPTFTGGESIAWRVYKEGEPLVYDDIRDDSDVYNPGTPMRSEMFLPLGDYGIMIAGSPTSNTFDRQDKVLAKILANNVTAALQQVDRTNELRERERELAKQNERLDQFASIISHDLRNPLNVASGELDQLTREVDSEHIANIEWAHDRMDELIEDMLTLACEGVDVGETERIDLRRLVEDCKRNIATETATIRCIDSKTLTADESRVAQVLENLFRNAVEHGGDSVTVTVGTMETGFYVEDDGPGIPPDDRDRIFETGYSPGVEGTGLGLAIVKNVADAHGWRLAVTDGTDGGARFEFSDVTFVD